jgi:hypothetical protein
MKRGLLILSFTLLAGSSPASADGFRCDSGLLVHGGDHMYEVTKKCGDPDAVGQRTEKRKVSQKVRRWSHGEMEEIEEEREVEVMIDEWIYDLGPQRRIRIVNFENSRVTCVHSGGWGTKKVD